MFTPLGTPRNLPFPLKDQVSNGNITDDLGLEPNDFVWPEDPEERAIIPFYLSQREFTAILSSVDVGADIAYPEQYVEVYWLLVRNLRYRVPICDLIIDCITNNPETKNAIRDFITGDPALREWVQEQQGIVPLEQLSTNFGAVPSCSPDNLFNVCTVAVDLLHSVAQDIFDAVEVGTNALERADLLVSGIPGIGAFLPFDEALGFAEKIVSSFQEAYLAAYDEDLEDEIRCGLFCQAKDDCDLTIADMIAYYEGKFGESLPTDIQQAFEDLIGFLRDGTFSGDTIVFGMHLLVLTGIRLAQDVMGFNFADLGLRLTAAQDETNNDWAVLCDECTDPNCYDLLVSPHTFTTYTGVPSDGAWVMGQGLRGGDGGTGWFRFNFTVPYAGVTKITVWWEGLPVVGSLRLRNQNGTADGSTGIGLTGATKSVVITRAAGTLTQNLYLGYSKSNGAAGNNNRIVKVCFE